MSDGRILKVRLGVNPNSSGHGVLFGSMFFLPYSVAASIIANACASGLDAALDAYRANGGESKPIDRASTVAIWGLSWAGFTAVWAVFLSSMVTLPIWGWILASCVEALPIIILAYLARRAPALALLSKRLLRLCLWGPLVGIVIALASGGSLLTAEPWGVIALYGYLTPLALVLAAAAARAGGVFQSPKWLQGASIAYVAIGFVLLFPIPPISTTSYNPVGLFFPLWGYGAPYALAAIGLTRIRKGSPS